MEQTVIKVGNSIGVVIPQRLRKELGFKPGDKIVVEKEITGQGLFLTKKGKGSQRSSITPEFMNWLNQFNKRYSRALKELAYK